MTREEALKIYIINQTKKDKEDLGFILIGEIFDAVELDTTCNGCKHKPEKGENYQEECGTCRRFYGDRYEEMK